MGVLSGNTIPEDEDEEDWKLVQLEEIYPDSEVSSCYFVPVHHSYNS